MQSKNRELEYLIYSHNWVLKKLQIQIQFFLQNSVSEVALYTSVHGPQYFISKQLIF